MTPWTTAAPAQQLQQHRRRPADPRQHGHAHATANVAQAVHAHLQLAAVHMQIATAHAQVRACLHRRARRHTLELEHLGAARAELHRHRGTGLQLHAAFDRRAVDAAIAVGIHATADAPGCSWSR
ncbi:hypothetical protein G6F63_015378 [Rhizopus arrhizus]|nr:hypothetical protein G6F63_015378 [Rhizopus arrhizus]